MLGRLVNDHMEDTPPAWFWGDTLPLWKRADFSLINLECALTHSETPWVKTPKVFHFRADPDLAVAVLKAADIGFVNLANNHVLDFQEAGLNDTLKTLHAAGIGFCGAGRDLEEAAAPRFVQAGGLRIAIIGATDNVPEWKATAESPGVNYVEISEEGAAEISGSIRAARKKADLVIFSLHWGPNMRIRPSLAFVNFAHAVVEAGADIVHGHSAHVFQGLEIYRNSVIMYDTGDFIDDYAIDSMLRNDESFLFMLDAEAQGGVSAVTMYPTMIDYFQARLAADDDRDEIIRRMQLLSRDMGTDAERTNNELRVDVQRTAAAVGGQSRTRRSS